jgi:hypothetical protein
MKCPSCENQHKHKYGMRCSCGYQFALDPKTDKISDGKMTGLIRRASNNDTYNFTENQLYAAYCRDQYKEAKTGACGCLLLLGAVPIVVGIINWKDFGTGAVAIVSVGAALMLLGVISYQWAIFYSAPDRKTFKSKVGKFNGKHKIKGMLRNAGRVQSPPPEWKEPNIYDYGVEQILIVNQDLYVDLFVLNNFHAEHKTLVISENGYPNYLMPIVKETLAKQPDVTVFLMHDATKSGVAMESRIRHTGQFELSGHAVKGLGLTPDDIAKLPRKWGLKARAFDNQVPLDALSYMALAGGMALAMREGSSAGEHLIAHDGGATYIGITDGYG